jgi:hypothetical protein
MLSHSPKSTEPIAFATAPDPLWRDVPLDHRTVVLPFGVPVIVESNSAHAIELVERNFGRDPDSGERQSPEHAEPIRFRLILEPARTRHTGSELVKCRVPDADHVLYGAPGLVGWLDLSAAQGIMYVEVTHLEMPERFSDAVIRAPILTLVTRRDRHPIHAAAIRRGDSALLLQGPSGIGKSTLSYAASCAGFDVFADDAVRVQQRPEFRVWGGGIPGYVYLLDDAVERFGVPRAPDRLRVRPNGKSKQVVSLPTIAGGLPPHVRRARVCLLRRDRGPVRCQPATPGEIITAILGAAEAQCDLYPAGRIAAAHALAAPGGWTLTLSDDVAEALPHLNEMLSAV